MDSGIYALYWWEQDLCYIGLSSRLSKRREEHYRMLQQSRHTNYKVQDAYDRFGPPEFIVLEYCSVTSLPDKESYWCKEFDALGPNGLCLVEPGIVGFGPDSNSSKYSKTLILKVFSLLYRGTYTGKEISERLSVPVMLISDIRNRKTHRWLEVSYPEKYLKMLNNNARDILANSKGIRGVLLSPTGELIPVLSISNFCREFLSSIEDRSHISSLLRGKRKSHKGYRLAGPITKI